MKDSDLGLKCLKVHPLASGTNICAAFTQICFPVSQHTHKHIHFLFSCCLNQLLTATCILNNTRTLCVLIFSSSALHHLTAKAMACGFSLFTSH